MKVQFAKYNQAILFAAAFMILCAANFHTNAQFAAENDALKGLQDQAAIEYLKQKNDYDSLAEAVKQAQLAENPSESELRFIQRQMLTASDGGAGEGFGGSVAISGDTAVVGAEFAASSRGAAYVFVRAGNGWTQQAKLIANDGAANDLFGVSVAISGDTIIVGASQDDISSNNLQGSAYVFVRNGTTWTAQEKLVANDGGTSDYFGNSVEISGETVIIGARGDDISSNTDQGSAYVYVRNGGAWALQQKLTASNGTAFSFFGTSVSITSGTAIIGAPEASINGVKQGAAYVFGRSGSTWTQQTRLTASDGAQDDSFGISVNLSLTLSGAVAIVGASTDDIAGNSNQGSAYVFNRSQSGFWSQTQKLVAGGGGSNDYFGRSVSIVPTTGSAIVVGTLDESAYVYRRVDSVWTQQQKIMAFDGTSNGFFGASVAVTGDTVFVGAYQKNINGNFSQGAAYVFNLGSASPFDFDGDGKADVSIFRPSNGQWWLNKSSDNQIFSTQFGQSSDVIAPADFTGDGRTDIAVFRPSNGNWYVLRSDDNTFYAFGFGTNGDTPAPGDYDGDGKADAAVFRPSDATWYILRSTGGVSIQQFGNALDLPVPADYDGDGKDDIAIFRPNGSSGGAEWWSLRTSTGVFATQFGTATDKTVVGDYTGDGKADIAFWRPSTGQWFVLRSENLSFYAFPFGSNGDVPAPGDYDGDGRTDAAVFRPSNTNWFIQGSTSGVIIRQFGFSNDLPIPNAFVR